MRRKLAFVFKELQVGWANNKKQLKENGMKIQWNILEWCFVLFGFFKIEHHIHFNFTAIFYIYIYIYIYIKSGMYFLRKLSSSFSLRLFFWFGNLGEFGSNPWIPMTSLQRLKLLMEKMSSSVSSFHQFGATKTIYFWRNTLYLFLYFFETIRDVWYHPRCLFFHLWSIPEEVSEVLLLRKTNECPLKKLEDDSFPSWNSSFFWGHVNFFGGCRNCSCSIWTHLGTA